MTFVWKRVFILQNYEQNLKPLLMLTLLMVSVMVGGEALFVLPSPLSLPHLTTTYYNLWRLEAARKMPSLHMEQPSSCSLPIHCCPMEPASAVYPTPTQLPGLPSLRPQQACWFRPTSCGGRELWSLHSLPSLEHLSHLPL